MISVSVFSILCLSFSYTTTAYSGTLAQPAIQHRSLPSRSLYQGGWPLSLAGSASTDCPDFASVQCASTLINPACCPGGQTCIFGAGQYANYCCPTDADCNTAVLNFPACANSTWIMFQEKSGGGYFCCAPGQIGVNPDSGLGGGICEPPDQVIPKTLLATIVGQVGAATPTPSATGGSSNATTTGAGGAVETNPSAVPSPTSTSVNGDIASITSHWSNPLKIGVGIGSVVAIVLILALCSCVKRRRNANRISGVSRYNAYGSGHSYDEFGNLITTSVYASGGQQFEPYRRADAPANNVTVNVVHGDQQT